MKILEISSETPLRLLDEAKVVAFNTSDCEMLVAYPEESDSITRFVKSGFILTKGDDGYMLILSRGRYERSSRNNSSLEEIGVL